MAEQREEALHVIIIPDDGAGVLGFHHPLAEISESPGHLLLLKLFQREEDRGALRAAALESQLDAARHHASGLSFLLLAFHALSLSLIFAASFSGKDDGDAAVAICKNWWVPSSISLLTSLVVVSCVQASVLGFWRVSKELERERASGRAVVRLAQELRMKGAGFDLSKVPPATKRMKSSSVETSWKKQLRWCSHNLVAICLLCASLLVFPASKFLLCG